MKMQNTYNGNALQIKLHQVFSHVCHYKPGIYFIRNRRAQSTESAYKIYTEENDIYLTIIPRVRIGSESIAHEAEIKTSL